MEPQQEQALAAEEAGNLPAALELWKSLADEHGKPKFFLRYGYVAQELGKWDEAEQAFLRLLAQPHHHFEITMFMGALWEERTDKDKSESLQGAKHWYLEALKIKRHVVPLTLLGATYLRLKDADSARKAFEEALELDPNYEEALYNLALIEKRTNLQKSRDLLERAIQIDPGYLIAHRVLGRVCQRMEDFDRAKHHFRRCLEIDPTDSISHHEIGKVYQRMKDRDRAEYHFRRCLEISPTDYWATLFLANLLGVMKRNEEAEQTYRHAIELRPDLVGGVEFFARFLESIGKNAEAASERAKANLSDRYAAGV